MGAAPVPSSETGLGTVWTIVVGGVLAVVALFAIFSYLQMRLMDELGRK